MTLNSVDSWKDSINGIPPQKAQPKANLELANAVESETTGKMELSGIQGDVSFTFNKGIFAAQLSAAVPSPAAPPAVAVIVNAWVAAVNASVMLVPPGSSLGSPSPATTWSAVASTLVDPPSVVAASSHLQTQLLSAPPVDKPEDAILGPALRESFLLLTYTVTGTNSVSPPSGPNPLVAAATPVV